MQVRELNLCCAGLMMTSESYKLFFCRPPSILLKHVPEQLVCTVLGPMQKIKNALFGRPAEEVAREETRKWKRELTANIRSVEKSIRETNALINTHLREVKVVLRKSGRQNAAVLAREVVKTQKYLKRLFVSKSLMTQIQRELDHSLGLMRVGGALQKSVSIMTYMNRLVRIPELAVVMKTMAREMDKLGIIDELMDDALGNGSDEEKEEDEVDEEVNRIIDGMNIAQIHDLPSVGRSPAETSSRERSGDASAAAVAENAPGAT